MEYGLTDLLRLFGSLGLFLYGMKVMSEALMKLAGDQMRQFLARATANRLLGVLSGFGITSVIQSSSATTLMVVSFANASLLSLTEAISVIMGANIGTTVTAWLIALLGFKVDMAAISLPLIGGGFLLTFAKPERRQQWGLFIIGFALLFIGLQYLKDAVPDLKANPDALAFLQAYTSQGYWSLLLFMVIGTILTIVIQSSSATMAITIIMCFEGWIPFQLAAAMVLGENIGTTITANLAAIVANYQARRAARAHLIFNLTGVTWMLLLISPFLAMIDTIAQQLEGISPFNNPLAIPVALSLFHTLFNVINTMILVNFIPQIARLVIRLVPEVADRRLDISRPQFLSEGAMDYPETAIKALVDESRRLFSDTTYKVVTHGLHVHRSIFEQDIKLKKIIRSVEKIELNVDDIYLTKIKTIYGEIIAFAIRVQDGLNLSAEQLTEIQDVLRADRLIVDVVKSIKPLHENMFHYLNQDNESIREQYNRLRKLILKVLRLTKKIMDTEVVTDKQVIKFRSLHKAVESYDALYNETVQQLIREQKIDNRMASSLMNDSMLSMSIAKNLILISSLLYMKADIFSSQLEDHIQPVAEAGTN